jgi:hypothetical protein
LFIHFRRKDWILNSEVLITEATHLRRRYRTIQLLIYTICDGLELVLPAFILTLVVVTVTVNVITIRLHQSLVNIRELSEAGLDSNSNSDIKILVQIWTPIFPLFCFINIAVLKITIGIFAQFMALSQSSLYSWKKVLQGKVMRSFLRSCRPIHIQIGAFGRVGRRAFIIALAVVLDYTVICLIVY